MAGRRRYDLLVVGAGPAGAVAALQAKLLDPRLRVALLDKATFPRDKACGDGIAPQAVDELRALGAEAAVAGYRPVARLRLRSPHGEEVAGCFARPTYVVPRAVFDARIVDAAVTAGVELRSERVRAVTDRGDHVAVGEHEAAVVVAADGANSTVRRLLGIAPNPPGHRAIAVRGYAPAPAGEPEQLIAMTTDGWPAYGWSFPIGDGRANVGFGLVRRTLTGGKAQLHGRLAALLPNQPADPASLRAHHLPLSTARPVPHHGRVLLAGDAASLINPLTGEGIYYAVLSGRLAGDAAVRAVAAPGPAYARALRHRLGRHLRQTDVLAELTRSARVVDAGVRAARRHRIVLDELVEVGLARGIISAASLARVAAAYPSAGTRRMRVTGPAL